jgi:hypothetical protein
MSDRLFDTGIFDSGIFKTEVPIPGIYDTGIFDNADPFGIFDHRIPSAAASPSAGWSGWLNELPRPRRLEGDADEPPPKRKRRKKRNLTPEAPFALAPDPLIERGVVQITPAWDVMVQIQQMQAEAEIARLERLRAIALADDEWLMMA